MEDRYAEEWAKYMERLYPVLAAAASKNSAKAEPSEFLEPLKRDGAGVLSFPKTRGGRRRG